jgi:nitroreductase
MADYGIVPFDLTPAECIPTQIGNAADAESLEALIKSRRMTRSFKKELVDHETIRHIWQNVLIYAPSGHNTRGHKALVVEGSDKIENLTELSLQNFQKLIDVSGLHSFDEKVFKRMILAWKEGKDRVFRTANQLVILHCKSSIVPSDAAQKVYMTYFELLANSMGIGTVWAGYFMVAANSPAIKAYLDIPEDESIYAAMMFGYPEFIYDSIPKRPPIELEFLK